MRDRLLIVVLFAAGCSSGRLSPVGRRSAPHALALVRARALTSELQWGGPEASIAVRRRARAAPSGTTPNER